MNNQPPEPLQPTSKAVFTAKNTACIRCHSQSAAHVARCTHSHVCQTQRYKPSHYRKRSNVKSRVRSHKQLLICWCLDEPRDHSWLAAGGQHTYSLRTKWSFIKQFHSTRPYYPASIEELSQHWCGLNSSMEGAAMVCTRASQIHGLPGSRSA